MNSYVIIHFSLLNLALSYTLYILVKLIVLFVLDCLYFEILKCTLISSYDFKSTA